MRSLGKTIRLWSRVASGGVVFLALVTLVGCSDDIVCPLNENEGDPFIGASVLETRLAGGVHTSVRVFCTSDPLPGMFIVSVSDRSIL